MYALFRKLFFLLDAEKAHLLVMRWMRAFCSPAWARKLLKARFLVQGPSLERTLWGIRFPNPVGLAAGFDKDASYTDALSTLGFGFIEIGTVTPRPQPGNPKPRLFRLPADKALINRMGFNNLGAQNAAAQLAKRKERIIIGGNIGKNKDTANENADADYEQCFRDLYDYVDYFVVNVSSPNTPGLRQLQDKEPLTRLLHSLMEINRSMQHKPLLLKIAPDLSREQLDEITDIVLETGISGIVATNTTIERGGLTTVPGIVAEMGAGGLSGAPLRKRSTEVVRYLHQKSGGAFPIIASGGIFTAADAQEKLDAGASLVQVYTGFIYEGPGIARKINKGLLKNQMGQ